MRPRRVVMQAGGLIRNERIVVPTVPQPGHHLLEFARTRIALGVHVMRIAVEIQRFIGGVGGHQIPAGTPAGEMIQRGELARHVIRLVIAGGHGGDQTDALAHHCQRAEQGERLEQAGTRHARGHRPTGRSQTIGNEHRIELRGFGNAHHLAVMVEHQRVGTGLRMTPRRHMVAGGHQECAQRQLTWRAHRSAPRTAAMSLLTATSRNITPIRQKSLCTCSPT